MNERRVYMLSENMERQCVAEDSKTRVYLSLVRDKNNRSKRAKEIQRRRNKRQIIRLSLIAGAEVLKAFLTLKVMSFTYWHLQEQLRVWRGANAMGSEVIFVGFIGMAAWLAFDWIIGGRNDKGNI